MVCAWHSEKEGRFSGLSAAASARTGRVGDGGRSRGLPPANHIEALDEAPHLQCNEIFPVYPPAVGTNVKLLKGTCRLRQETMLNQILLGCAKQSVQVHALAKGGGRWTQVELAEHFDQLLGWISRSQIVAMTHLIMLQQADISRQQDAIFS
jgi:hypothetical protein